MKDVGDIVNNFTKCSRTVLLSKHTYSRNIRDFKTKDSKIIRYYTEPKILRINCKLTHSVCFRSSKKGLSEVNIYT